MNPAVGTLSWQSVPPPPAANRCLPACQSCQRRRSKCDRSDPCSQCVKYGTECVASTRKPRSRGYKRKSKDEALQNRIAKLESVLATLSSKECISNQRKTSPALKYIGASFWMSLVIEIQELRDVLDQDLPHEEHSCCSSTDGTPQKNNDRLIRSTKSIHTIVYTLPEPSAQLSATLCGVFCRNVNPLFRTFHAPTLEDFMVRGCPYLGRGHEMKGSKLIKAVVWFGATNTLSESECDMLFGQSRTKQLELFRRLVDVALIQAKFLRANDVVILQALLMYIATSRQTDTTRRGWTLLSVAARQSLALGLNDETRNRSPFATELRRRLWHQMRFLDTFYALDRGEEPLIKETANAIPLPKNCNDVEFSVFSQDIPEYKASLMTDLTFSRMAYEAIEYIRSFSVSNLDVNSGTTWQHRLKIAERFRGDMHKRYLRHCALLDPFQRLLHTICKSLIASVLLRAVLPMRNLCSESLSPRIDDPYILELALNSLKASDAVCSDPETRRWHWLLWVPWQPLAIALAGLCTIRDTGLADETWVYVHKGCDRYSRHVADARKGLLWEPLEKLYRRASAFRERRTSSSWEDSPSMICKADGRSMVNSEVQLKPAATRTEGTWDETVDASCDIGHAQWMAAGAGFWNTSWMGSQKVCEEYT